MEHSTIRAIVAYHGPSAQGRIKISPESEMGCCNTPDHVVGKLTRVSNQRWIGAPLDGRKTGTPVVSVGELSGLAMGVAGAH